MEVQWRRGAVEDENNEKGKATEKKEQVSEEGCNGRGGTTEPVFC